MKVAAVTPDLMTFSRIEAAARAAGATVDRVESPSELPLATTLDLVLVDWGARRPSWGSDLSAWSGGFDPRRARVIAFGPHTDLSAHADAREANLAPMWARSRLFGSLPGLLRPPSAVAADTASAASEE